MGVTAAMKISLKLKRISSMIVQKVKFTCYAERIFLRSPSPQVLILTCVFTADIRAVMTSFGISPHDAFIEITQGCYRTGRDHDEFPKVEASSASTVGSLILDNPSEIR